MASRKLTQLPTATEVTASDKIYIVDVSDTSESPQGTSKQAVISELPTSGITTLTSTDGSIDIDLTDPSAPDLSIPSAMFDPVISNITNDATVDVTTGFYYRSGSFVTLNFKVDITLDAAAVSTVFNFSLPISSSFTNDKQMIVTCDLPENLTFFLSQSDAVEDKGRVTVFGTANGDSILGLSISATYQIL